MGLGHLGLTSRLGIEMFPLVGEYGAEVSQPEQQNREGEVLVHMVGEYGAEAS